MNYTNVTEIKKYLESLKRQGKNYFGKIEFNNFFIELTAGQIAMCEPKVYYNNILHYKKIQVSIHEIIREEEYAISPNRDERFAGFAWTKYFTYFNNKAQVTPSYIGDRIPVTEVIDLIRDTYKISRLKIFY